jgi:DNA-binding NarL/FixJ family response regulator
MRARGFQGCKRVVLSAPPWNNGLPPFTVMQHTTFAHVREFTPAAECALLATGSSNAQRRILVVDDHALLRLGLRAVLEAGPVELEVLEAGCLQDALEACRTQQPIDLVLLDLNMTDCRGLQGLRQLRDAFPDIKVAVLSATQDEFVVRQAQALGAAAYIAKSHEPQAMSQRVLALLRLDASGDAALSGFPSSGRTASYDRVAELGSRHLEILDLVLFGCSNQEIANATHLSLGTVKNYVSTILLALDVKSRSHLISLFR